MLSPSLLTLLRPWWREGHLLGKMLPRGWLFPGINPVDPLAPRQLNRMVKLAADAAGIDNRVSMPAVPPLNAVSLWSLRGMAHGASLRWSWDS